MVSRYLKAKKIASALAEAIFFMIKISLGSLPILSMIQA
jgi:hypothetical protein